MSERKCDFKRIGENLYECRRCNAEAEGYTAAPPCQANPPAPSEVYSSPPTVNHAAEVERLKQEWRTQAADLGRLSREMTAEAVKAERARCIRIVEQRCDYADSVKGSDTSSLIKSIKHSATMLMRVPGSDNAVVEKESE